MALVEAFDYILEAANILEVILLLLPVCLTLASGVVIGWVWRPKWETLDKTKIGSSPLPLPSSPSRSIRSPLKGFGSAPCLNSFKLRCLNAESFTLKDRKVRKLRPRPPSIFEDCRSTEFNENLTLLTEKDLAHLCHLVEMKDGGPSWAHVQDRYTSNMSYQAWRRDPKTGPPQYHTRTVFEGATPEMVRDFFWDDDFRSKWDDMLACSSIIAECPITGNMVVQWVRKFPFFCNDREYVIGRRIWDLERSYYCVTKAVPSSIPRREKPKRVDQYYSSWCIRAIESRRDVGQLTACEVLLFHHEDMGIPYEVAKLGVKQGMWGAVKKIEQGLRAYQKLRHSGEPLSRPAFMAQNSTKISSELLKSLDITNDSSPRKGAAMLHTRKPAGQKVPRALLIGGFVAVALSLDRGLLTKAIILGITRKFARLRKKR